MLPDVLDEFMLQTGTRQDAIFYSFYVFYSKLAAGVGLGISQLALEYVTYTHIKYINPIVEYIVWFSSNYLTTFSISKLIAN